MRSIKILGVCSGNGTLLHSMKKYLIGNIEPRSVYYTKRQKGWTCNFGEIPYFKSLEEASKVELKPNVIVGHPDCGSGSVLSYSRAKKLSSIEFNDSFLTFKKAVDKYKPQVFLFENLEAMFKNYPKKNFKRLYKRYNLIFYTVSVSRFGNSQIHRKRLIVVGIRKNKPFQKECFKLPKISKYKPLKSKELLLGLNETDLDLGHYIEPLDQIITIYGGCKMSLKEIKDIWLGKLKHKSRFLVTDRKYVTAPGVYKNLANKPPSTARKQNRQFNHKGEMMSPRELARIQGLPDNFILPIDKATLKGDINKARVTVTKCPPYELGSWFLSSLKKYKRVIEDIIPTKNTI